MLVIVHDERHNVVYKKHLDGKRCKVRFSENKKFTKEIPENENPD